MSTQRPSLVRVFCILSLGLFALPSLQAQTETVIYNFGGGTGYILPPANPYAGVTFDSAGNLYGTSLEGGNSNPYSNGCSGGCGTVFKLTPTQSGTWQQSIIFMGFSLGLDQANPAAPVIFDHEGNIYSTSSCATDCGNNSGGALFRLTPLSNGSWAYSVLLPFGGHGCIGYYLCTAGVSPSGHVYASINDTFFHTRCEFYCGLLLKIPLTLNSFYGFPRDGALGIGPYGPLAFDGAGNIYGTTGAGPPVTYEPGNGLVYEVTVDPSGGLEGETPLYRFAGGDDGADPAGGVIFDTAGNLYGATAGGGSSGQGTIFMLSPQSDGSWTHTVLYSFRGGSDAAMPNSVLAIDSSGDLYGTAGGGSSGQGTVFKLTPAGQGQWTERVLYSFSGALDGGVPSGGVAIDRNNRLYGTTQSGGTHNAGVAFRITQ